VTRTQKSTVRRVVRGAGTVKPRMETQTITSDDRQESCVRHDSGRLFVSCGRQIDCDKFAISTIETFELPSPAVPVGNHRRRCLGDCCGQINQDRSGTYPCRTRLPTQSEIAWNIWAVKQPVKKQSINNVKLAPRLRKCYPRPRRAISSSELATSSALPIRRKKSRASIARRCDSSVLPSLNAAYPSERLTSC